jgi:FtsP/CotA-like multicopper oxidase with cupredoxin domain
MRIAPSLVFFLPLWVLGPTSPFGQARVILPRQSVGQPIIDTTGGSASSLTNSYPASPTSSADSNGTTGRSQTAPYSNSQQVPEWPVKYYDFTLTWGSVNSNGEPRQAILINGQTPGPLIELEEGQQVSVSRALETVPSRRLH